MYKKKFTNDLKNAMREKNTDKVLLLRMLISALDNEAISLGKKEEGLAEAEELKVLKREVKKRKDSISQYEAANRPELAAAEKKELEILTTYLPKEMGEEKVRKIVEEVIASMGEVAPSSFGQVMGAVMAKTSGSADGSVVSKIVKETLNK